MQRDLTRVASSPQNAELDSLSSLESMGSEYSSFLVKPDERQECVVVTADDQEFRCSMRSLHSFSKIEPRLESDSQGRTVWKARIAVHAPVFNLAQDFAREHSRHSHNTLLLTTWLDEFSRRNVQALPVLLCAGIDLGDGRLFQFCLTCIRRIVTTLEASEIELVLMPSSTPSRNSGAEEVNSHRRASSAKLKSNAERDLQSVQAPLEPSAEFMKSFVHVETAREMSAAMSSATGVVASELVKACCLCSSSFTLTNRPHHCRVCCRVFCSSCSSYFVELDEEDKLRTEDMLGVTAWHKIMNSAKQVLTGHSSSASRVCYFCFVRCTGTISS
jgi:hypothetical protein